MIISKYEGKSPEKNQHVFMIKTLNRLEEVNLSLSVMI